VYVEDTTPPAIDSHGDESALATGSNGAVVNFVNPTTSDLVDGAGEADCDPPSGSLFPIGDTVVTCAASDSHENLAEPITFVVHVVNDNTSNGGGQPGGGTGGSFEPASEIVPLTGGQPSELSCTTATTVLHMAGFEVAFANLCGYSSLLDEAAEVSLIATLPDGDVFISGIDITLIQNGVLVNSLPAGAGITLSFELPAGMTGETLTLLYWDPSAKGGEGDWIELATTIEYGQVVVLLTPDTPVTFPGSFALVDKNTEGAHKPSSFAWANGLFASVTQWFASFGW